MVTQFFVEQVITKVKSIYIFISLVITVSLGIIINFIEPYPDFYILFPILLIMSLSTIMLLKKCFKKMIEFKKECEEKQIFKYALDALFAEKRNVGVLFIYINIMIMYFLCLYNLQFIELNIMGWYILFLGNGTLIMALIAYEIYIRFTIVLCRVSTDITSLHNNYNVYSPDHTEWLQKIHLLSKIFKNASFIIGLLFVFENSMLFFANINKLNKYINIANFTFLEKISKLPVEFWIIWLLVSIAIAIAFPIIAVIQLNNIKKIINQISIFYNNKVTIEYMDSNNEKNILNHYLIMNMIKCVETALNEKYIPPKIDKLIAVLTSLLTCIVHLTTFYNLFT